MLLVDGEVVLLSGRFNSRQVPLAILYADGIFTEPNLHALVYFAFEAEILERTPVQINWVCLDRHVILVTAKIFIGKFHVW